MASQALRSPFSGARGIVTSLARNALYLIHSFLMPLISGSKPSVLN